MSRNYYLFSSGKLSRKDNTFIFKSADGARRVLPVVDVEAFYIFGEMDFNTKFLDFLAQHKITFHVFNYYGFYSGSYYPREFLNSGFLLVKQVDFHQDGNRRIEIARRIIDGAAANIQRNLKYYNKESRGLDFAKEIEEINSLAECCKGVCAVDELMGIEGNIREKYYSCFESILSERFSFKKREKRPPTNPVNALISFGNMMLYTTVLSEIYKTQLNPLISYLHQPGYRRFSLALDISEIFKPLLVDRIVFKLINTGMIKEKHFSAELEYCYLNEAGRKIFVQEYDEKLKTTIKHRKLGRNVSYRRLIRLECYKLIKHLLGESEYEPFKIWW